MTATFPRRLKLLGWGRNPICKFGPLPEGSPPPTVSFRSAERLPQNQRRYGFDKIALDFEHNTVPGSPEYERSQEPRPVAAYGVPRVVPGEGLFLEDIQWVSPEAAANYPDVSAAVQMDREGHVIFIHSGALTRAGAVPGMHLALNSAPRMSGFERTAAIFAEQTGTSRKAPPAPAQTGLARVAAKFAAQVDAVYRSKAGLSPLSSPRPKPS